MKIKTVVHDIPEKFDAIVNEYIAKGYCLNDCGPQQVGSYEWKLYARLVLLEEDDR